MFVKAMGGLSYRLTLKEEEGRREKMISCYNEEKENRAKDWICESH